jgi:hypothetical protein
MGEPTPSAGQGAARLEAFRRKLAEFEAMGLDTTSLARVLEESPDDFERQAEAFLRRELTGEEGPPQEGELPADHVGPESAPGGGAATAAPPGPETPPGRTAEPSQSPELQGAEALGGADEPVESPPAAKDEAVGAPHGPEAAAPEGTAAPEVTDVEAPGGAEGTAPEPAATSTSAGGEAPPVDAIEEAMMEELEEAIAQEGGEEPGQASARPAAPPAAPPPLASGDSLALGEAKRPPVKALPVKETAGAPPAAAGAKKPPPPAAARKPAPPGAQASAGPAPAAPPLASGTAPVAVRTVVRPVKVVAKDAKRPAPLGARPTAAQGPGAAEVLPATPRGHGRALGAAAVFLVIGAVVGVYLLMANAPPVAVIEFGGGPHVAGEPITFSANGSSDPNGDTLSFAWEFGDGSRANGSFATHAYTRSGNYSVNLTATDPDGLSTRTQAPLAVFAGSITPPPYRYGDRLGSTVRGTSKVEATGTNPQPLGTFTASLPPLESTERTYAIWGVNLTYTGSQQREVGTQPRFVPDGYLVQQETYESRRALDLDLSGNVDTSLTELSYTGDSTVVQSDFNTLLANDTVRRLSTQDTTIQIQNTDPPTVLASSARLIEYPDLATAAEQLHLEDVYVGHAFSTERQEQGVLHAEGYDWTWATQGTELVAGQLTVAINFTLADLVSGTSFTTLWMKVWVSSASSFPLKEQYYIRAIEVGRTYESFFESVAADKGAPGTADIAYANQVGLYPPPAASLFTPLDRVPTGGAQPDFDFSATDAYNEAVAASTDFTAFLASNPTAYAVNGSYGLNGGNPRWLLDFDDAGAGEMMRIDVERAGSYVVRTGGGQDDADATRDAVGSVVSLDFAVGILEDEEQASALFPGGVLTSIHANFTIRTALPVPSLSFNAASAATRPDIAYALGVESRPDEATRIRGTIDAATGQLAFSLSETGDSLP